MVVLIFFVVVVLPPAAQGWGCVTGALARELLASAVDVAVTTSQSTPSEPQGYHCHAGFPLSIDTDWGAALEGISVVVHCAARVHVMRDGTLVKPY